MPMGMSDDTTEVTIDENTARDLLREMVRIRRFEETATERSNAGEIPGFLHLCTGHEGSHAGMGVAMDRDDWLAVGGARLHGQYIVKGVPMERIMAELYGKRAGSNHGKGGSMHVSDVSRRLYGHAATIGSGQNPAVGMALAEEMQGTDNVAVTTLGDGGTSRGTFHTALVFAAYWQLPVVFVIENNEWAISTPAESLPLEHLSDYGEPLENVETASIDGSDVETVYHTVTEAIERARAGGGPSVIESRVARLVGHFQADPETYRDEEEKARLRAERDPLANYRDRLLDAGVLSQSAYDDLEAEVEAEVDDAVAFAQEADFPDPSAAQEHVYRRPLYGGE